MAVNGRGLEYFTPGGGDTLLWRSVPSVRYRVPRLARATCVAIAALLVAACAGYGGETIDAPAGGQVKSEGEHCALTLPEGWRWRPASWTAISPAGTHMSFGEDLLGRPRYADWEELVSTARANLSSSAAQVTETDDSLRIDYGTRGGLSILRRFDNTACQVTFSYVKGAREQEHDDWEAIIESMAKSVPGE
jgi:hypothetical protein